MEWLEGRGPQGQRGLGGQGLGPSKPHLFHLAGKRKEDNPLGSGSSQECWGAMEGFQAGDDRIPSPGCGRARQGSRRGRLGSGAQDM